MARVKPSIRPTETYTEPNFLRVYTAGQSEPRSQRLATIAEDPRAVEQFRAALKARPGTGVWWLGLAISLQALNRGPEAQAAYRRAKTTNNLNAELAAFADQRLRQLR